MDTPFNFQLVEMIGIHIWKCWPSSGMKVSWNEKYRLWAGDGSEAYFVGPEMMADRQRRIRESGLEPVCRQVCIGCDLALTGWKDDLVNAGFRAEKQFFGSLLGISYYLSKDAFRNLLMEISSISCAGSSICFDYPQSSDGTESRRNRELAAAAGEQMKAQYSRDELEKLLSEAGFLVYEHLNADEAAETFFQHYNRRNMEHCMTAPEGVGYCLAVKQVE